VLSQILAELSQREQPVRQSPAARIAECITCSQAGVRDEPGWQFMEAIQQALPHDAVVTNDASRANGWAIYYLKRSLPNTFNITGNMGALGYAFPAAVGAKLAYPDRQALAIVGDGGFQFTLFSLGTAVQHRINAVAVVFNDGSYGRIKRMQSQHFERTIGADLPSPDFVRLAESYGAAGCQAVDPQQLHDALVAAWQRDVPTVIEVPIEERRALSS
jgi:acetolactate synthase-1/2/3 large subunit